jgi:UDPglucose--hexose-1-phosphate uridylyltransferase
MSPITFEKTSSTFTILNPFNNFTPEEHRVEVRKDPLLGDTSVHNPFLRDKAKAFFGDNDRELVKKLVEDSEKNCIFCGENVITKTARYPSDILPDGRVRAGDAVLFANLFSVAAYHPVIALGSTHFLSLNEFTSRLLSDGFRAAREFLRSLYLKDNGAVYSTVCANYLLPAGASLVHPHMQMLVSPTPYSYQARVLEACRHYYKEQGTSYYSDLISEEQRRGERYIRQNNRWHWLSAFSPQGSNEIMAIHEQESDFAALTDREVHDLSEGIVRVLHLYEHLGYLSFNFALYSVRSSAAAEGFRCVFKIITRQNLYPNYRNDDYFLQKMLQSELIFMLPEDLAEQLRTLFQASEEGHG